MDSFIQDRLAYAELDATVARIECERGNIARAAKLITSAILLVGMAQHPVADSTSPSHAGFQPWLGPKEGTDLLGPVGYIDFVQRHEKREGEDSYKALGNGPALFIEGQFSDVLLDILAQ